MIPGWTKTPKEWPDRWILKVIPGLYQAIQFFILIHVISCNRLEVFSTYFFEGSLVILLKVPLGHQNDIRTIRKYMIISIGTTHHPTHIGSIKIINPLVIWCLQFTAFFLMPSNHQTKRLPNSSTNPMPNKTLSEYLPSYS